VLDRPKQAAHGDYAANIAAGARQAGATQSATACGSAGGRTATSKLVERIDIAGAGFINIVLTPAARQTIVARVLASAMHSACRRAHQGEPVMVEFVSANPTGPLHVGHAGKRHSATRSGTSLLRRVRGDA